MDKFVQWIYVNDLNEINRFIEIGEITKDIISITYDSNHGCYMLFYWE